MGAMWEGHKTPTKLFAGLRGYLRGWWARHIVDDYENLWG